MRFRSRAIVFVGLLGFLVSGAPGQLPQTQLFSVEPVAMGMGESGEVSVKGKDLDGPQRLLFSHPGITAAGITKEDALLKKSVLIENRFAVKVASNVPAGIYDVRLAGHHGVSNPWGFAVTDLPLAVREAGQIQKLKLDSAVCGVMPKEKEETFLIAMMAGQKARVTCLGRRLGSRLDGVLRVIGPDGKELVSSSRSGRTEDPEVTFAAKVGGEYLVTFFDFTYKGGDGFGYLLEVRSGEANLSPPENGLVAEDAGKDGGEEFVQKVGFPSKITGRFLGSDDVDVFEVEVGGGKRIQVDVQSDRLGEPTDPVLSVERVEVDGEGKVTLKLVVEGDDWGGPGGKVMRLSHRDPSVVFEASGERTRYRVTVWNRFPVQGEAKYRLEIGESKPEFELVVTAKLEGADPKRSEPVSPVVRAGGSARIQVYALRSAGFEGAIDLRVEGMPSGVTVEGGRIPEGRNEGVLVMRAAKGTGAWTGAVKVVGESHFNGAKVRREARFRGGLWVVNDMQREEMAARDADSIVVGVLGDSAPDVTVQPKEAKVIESCKGGKVAIPVTLAVGGGVTLKGNVAVTPVGIEGYAKVPNVQIAPGKEGTLNLDFKDGGGNVFKVGEYTMALRGEGQIDFEPGAERKEAAEKAKGEIVAALKAVEEELKESTAAKGEAVKKLELAKRKLGETKDPGDARTKAEGAMKAAEGASSKAVQAEADLKKKVDEGKKSLQVADQRIKQEVEKMKKRQVKFATFSQLMTVKLANSPIAVTAMPGAAAAGEKGEIAVKVERKYGFNANVQLTLAASGDSKGIKLNMPAANAAPGKDALMPVTVAGDSATGELELTLTAKGNFNGVNFQEQVPVKFIATPKKEAAAK